MEKVNIHGLLNDLVIVSLYHYDGKFYYWCPLKVRSIVPMCPQYYQTNIVDTFSKSKPLNQKA